MKSLLAYNLYPVNTWREVTKSILEGHNHQVVLVHVSLPWYKYFNPFARRFVLRFLYRITNVDVIIFSINQKKKGETKGFNKLRLAAKKYNPEIFTYTHSKGVSKRTHLNRNIRDWVLMMKYFVINRHFECIQAFISGYSLYGCNLIPRAKLQKNAPKNYFDELPFHYSGNFVSANVKKLSSIFYKTPVPKHYYGVECFWGLICSLEEAYSAYDSDVPDHYFFPYPKEKYCND